MRDLFHEPDTEAPSACASISPSRRIVRGPDELSADARPVLVRRSPVYSQVTVDNSERRRLQSLWKAHAPQLFADGLLGKENAEAVKHLCEALAVAQAAAGEIARDGITVLSASGTKKQNPAVAVLFQAQQRANELMRSLESERQTARILGTDRVL
jgi:hypothetical protein